MGRYNDNAVRSPVPELGPQIAEALGWEWTCTGPGRSDPNRVTHLAGPEEAIISLLTECGSCDPERDRLTLYGEYPLDPGQSRECVMRMPEVRITLKLDTPPAKIARAIKSRMLKKYWPVLAEAIRLRTDRRAQIARVEATLAKIAEATGGETRPSINKVEFGRGPGSASGSVEVKYTGDLINEISIRWISIEKAVRLLAFYRQMEANDG